MDFDSQCGKVLFFGFFLSNLLFQLLDLRLPFVDVVLTNHDLVKSIRGSSFDPCDFCIAMGCLVEMVLLCRKLRVQKLISSGQELRLIDILLQIDGRIALKQS
ncbi:hypothetical protein L195_g059350 [Trifolium pratense]|uniref:Uncharacterized protein n=1 Tax=Trifolium pratense TaxID=57577 RepID=A0A2K3JXH8_TRIPR|nr:hypothetical protein L195_g059350 [Trifolium pratense]